MALEREKAERLKYSQVFFFWVGKTKGEWEPGLHYAPSFCPFIWIRTLPPRPPPQTLSISILAFYFIVSLIHMEIH